MNYNVYDEFLKIAEEKGMISKDAPEKAKKQLESNPRADSLSKEKIEKLYNVKVDKPKDMEYENNIIEIAHKEPVVYSPSHDKINGLIENIQERQNIMLRIVNKHPNGQIFNHKYAEELALSLVRVGNLTQTTNTKLSSLADICLLQMSQSKKNQINKTANPYIIGAIAVAVGALYLSQHVSAVNEGFKLNHDRLVNELTDFTESHANFLYGTTYKKEFVNTIQDFISKLEAFKIIVDKESESISAIKKPKTGKELLEIAKTNGNEIQQSYYNLYNAFVDFVPYLNKTKENFKSQTFKVEEVEEKGFLNKLLDKTHVLHGGSGLIADDFDDVLQALDPYVESVKAYIDLLKTSKSKSDLAKSELSVAELPRNDEVFGPEQENNPVKSDDDQIKSLIK